MSVRVLTKVWELSQHAGTELLMLLALADFADDAGNAYPAVATLAAKTRMKPRNARYVLAALERSGELKVLPNAGPKGANRYRVMLDALGMQAGAGVQGNAGVQPLAGMQHSAVTPATHCRQPLQRIADKPLLNRHDPSIEGAEAPLSATQLPPCPQRKLVALFTEICVELPRPRLELWAQSPAAEAMRQRWKWFLTARREDGSPYATNSEEALSCFERFFRKVHESDFLSGRNGAWKACSLHWLMKRQNFTKVIEGQYDNDRRRRT